MPLCERVGYAWLFRKKNKAITEKKKKKQTPEPTHSFENWLLTLYLLVCVSE